MIIGGYDEAQGHPSGQSASSRVGGIIRELQELTQTELARRTKIPQSTISAFENDSINLGVERAKTLARVLECHPAVLVFPGWDVTKQSAA
jgi:transcriptional regulator with XRE-family HTH domain